LQTQPELQHVPSHAAWPAAQQAVPQLPVVHWPVQQSPPQQIWPDVQQTPLQAL
jgi:hypothetical protein